MTQRQTRANQIKQPNRKHTEQNTKSQKNNGNKQKQQRQTHIYIFVKKHQTQQTTGWTKQPQTYTHKNKKGEPQTQTHTTKNALELWGAVSLHAPELRGTFWWN